MASQDKHKDQAEHNFNLAGSLGEDEYRDWTITICFYSALHFTNLIFISDPKIGHIDQLYDKLKSSTETADQVRDVSIHAFRESIIGSKLPSIRTKYRQLRVMSQAVRYLENSSGMTGSEYIKPSAAKHALEDLSTIKTEVLKYLK